MRLSTLGLTGGALALPRTCVLLQQLRLEDILSSGKPLLRSLRDDLRLTIAPAGIDRLARGTAWGSFARAALDLVNRAVDRGSLSVLDAQAAFDLFKKMMPIIGATSVFDQSSRVQLERMIAERLDKAAIIAHCGGIAEAVACAKALVAGKPLAALRGVLANLGVNTAHSDVVSALAAFGTVEAHVPLIADRLTKLTIPLAQFPACRALKAHDIATCATAAARGLTSAFDFVQLADDLRLAEDQREKLLRTVPSRITQALADSEPIVMRSIQVGCEVRLAAAVLRSCSGQHCTADDISAMLEHPEQHFKPDPTPAAGAEIEAMVAALCWNNGTYRGVSDLGPYRGFVADGLELLAAKSSSAARVATVLRMFARLTQEAAGCHSGDAPIARCRQIDAITELLVAIAEDDHTKALASATALVRQLVPRIPPELTKGAQLIGSVVSYAEVYAATKGQDPKEAREARKKALEGLIDAATDRTGRGGAWVLSLGSMR